MFIEAKDDGGGGDNLSRKSCKALDHHQQTNIQCLTGRMPFLLPNQQCQSTIIIMSLKCLKRIYTAC